MIPDAESIAVLEPAGQASEPLREPHLLRFGLRRMFLFVSGFVVLGGMMTLAGGGWATAIAFVAALIAAHVLATMVGTRLRDSSQDVQNWRVAKGAPSERPPTTPRLSTAELAELAGTPLAQHESAKLRTSLALGVGMTTGGFTGAAVVPLIAGPEATGAGIALGAVSCGVICAWLALLVTHFWTVARRSWRYANADQRAGPSRRRRGWRRC